MIHKNNEGLADARNKALDMMKGEYVVCVDSDDYISSTHVEGLYKLIVKYGAYVAINTSCNFLMRPSLILRRSRKRYYL